MARKTITERKKALQEQIDKLEAEEKNEREKKYKIIGRVLSQAMQDNENTKRQIVELLDKQLTSNAERQLFGLSKLDTKRGRPATSE